MNDSIKQRIAHTERLLVQGAHIGSALKQARLSAPSWYAYRRKRAQSEAGAAKALNGEAIQPATASCCDQVAACPLDIIGNSLLYTFEQATRHDEMKGSCRPEEHAEIEQRYRISRALLVTYLKALLQ